MVVETILETIYEHQGWQKVVIDPRQVELQVMIEHALKWFRSPGWVHQTTYVHPRTEDLTYTELALVFSPSNVSTNLRDRFARLISTRDDQDPEHLFQILPEEAVGSIHCYQTLPIRQMRHISFHPRSMGLFKGLEGANHNFIYMNHLSEETAQAIMKLDWPYLVNTVDLSPLHLAKSLKVPDTQWTTKGEIIKVVEDDKRAAVKVDVFNIKSAARRAIRDIEEQPAYKRPYDVLGLLREVLDDFEKFSDFCYENL